MRHKIAIPKSFELHGHRIRVYREPKVAVKEGALGVTYPEANEIYVTSLPGTPEEQIEHTFFHELMHMIMHHMGERDLYENEKFIDMCAGFIHQALKTANY